jgi:acyl-coenzyme A thioesterase PaaI-like protein
MTALADQSLAFAAITMVPPNAAFRTSNLQVNFITGGRAHPLCNEARVVATTEHLLKVRSDFRRDDGKLIAEASARRLVAAAGA